MLKAKGQNLAEFALCLAVVAAALFSLQVYVKRNLQAKYRAGANYLFYGIRQEAGLRQAADSSELGYLISPSQQYDPYYATSDLTQAQGSAVEAQNLGRATGPSVEEKFSDGRKHTDAISGRSGWQKAGPAEDAD